MERSADDPLVWRCGDYAVADYLGYTRDLKTLVFVPGAYFPTVYTNFRSMETPPPWNRSLRGRHLTRPGDGDSFGRGISITPLAKDFSDSFALLLPGRPAAAVLTWQKTIGRGTAEISAAIGLHEIETGAERSVIPLEKNAPLHPSALEDITNPVRPLATAGDALLATVGNRIYRLSLGTGATSGFSEPLYFAPVLSVLAAPAKGELELTHMLLGGKARSTTRWPRITAEPSCWTPRPASSAATRKSCSTRRS